MSVLLLVIAVAILVKVSTDTTEKLCNQSERSIRGEVMKAAKTVCQNVDARKIEVPEIETSICEDLCASICDGMGSSDEVRLKLKEKPREKEPQNSSQNMATVPKDQVEAIVAAMSLKEKVCQLFIVAPEQLLGSGTVTSAGDSTRKKLSQYPVGGLIYFASNLKEPDQTKTMLKQTQSYAYELWNLPLFLCVDEEGGRVARIANNAAFGVGYVEPMQNIKDREAAYNVGARIGGYLWELGFNLDFAPNSDVLTNNSNTVIGDRSFGSDPTVVAEFAAAASDGLHAAHVMSTFKHFPGHGATEGDTHDGFAYTEKTYEQLLEAELVPFAAAKEYNVDAVMVAHISVPNVVGDDTPSSLSYRMITDILRGDLGYDGLVVTDAMNMGAIAKHYASDEAAVLAIQAGVDLLLMPKDFTQAVNGVMKAVENGTITQERLDESVLRIVKSKLEMGK